MVKKKLRKYSNQACIIENYSMVVRGVIKLS